MRFCVLLLTVTTALAWPVAWQGEEQQCPPMSDRLFESGFSYLHKYDAIVTSLIQGTSHDVTGMNIDCDVLVEAHSECMLVLKTEKCNLKSLGGERLPNNRQFSHDMSAHAVIVKMDNGKVIEVYFHPDEPIHIRNAKKGIATTIQLDLSSDASVTETNVNGNCTSKRVVIGRSRAGRVQEVSVVTDLNGCSRPKPKAVTLSPTSVLTSVQIAHKLINSTRVCSYELRDENIKKVDCRESHVFNPFSYNGQRGVATSIQQELKFKESMKLNSILKIKDNLVKKDLIYEFEEQQESANADSGRADKVLEQLVQGSLEEVQMDSARLFGELIVSIRSLNYDALKALFDKVKSGNVELAKTYMYDAIVQCGSIPCFKVMNDLIIDDTIPSPFSDALMYIMAFRQYPPLTLIEESLRVAQVHKKQSVILPLSIMVHNFYINNEAEIKLARELPQPLKESIRLMRDMIGTDCSVPAEIQGEERIEKNRRILLALKSIGNMGEVIQKHDNDEMYTAQHIVPRLKECIARKDVDHNITMAAIQAFRRFNIPSADEKGIRSKLKEVLYDSSRSNHARIASYLTVMRSHPTVAELAKIVDSMLSEPLMQVKAFVFSHIENVLESGEPTVQDLKVKLVAALGNRHLPEYPKDPLRYSTNIEKSEAINVPYFNQTVAAQIESNVIFRREHYLPHHVMLSTAITALGQSFQVFEIGAEMNGFEPALEAIFGPMGYYPDDILGSLFKQMDKQILSKMWDAYTFLLEEVKVQAVELSNTPWSELDDLLLTKLRQVKQAVLDKFGLTRPTDAPREESPMVQQMNEVLRQALPAEYEDQLNQIHNAIPREPTTPEASVYVKMLGNELGYVSLENIKAIIPKLNFSMENIKTVAVKYAEQLIENVAKGIEQNITKSFVFLERDFIIPTSTGLPLNCSVNGTAVLSMRMRAGVGVEPMTMKAYASGRIAPSASVDVVGTMGVKVPVIAEAAVLANAVAYHASSLEGNVTLNGAHLKLNLNTTKKPMHILTFSTNFFLVKPDGSLVYIPGVQQDRVEVKKCIGVTKKVLGIDLCVAWAYPNASYIDTAPRFPLTGPSSFNITIVNTDMALKTYTLEFQYKMLKKGGSTGKKTLSMIAKKKPSARPVEITDVILVNFTAPGQELRREISSLFTFNRAKYEAKWNISIPELQTYAFVGLLNLADPNTSTSGLHLVANATAGPVHNASVSTTLKKMVTPEKANYTAVFNASVMELYFANVMQYVRTEDHMVASTTLYYYWDDETPLYKQILFPVYDYHVNHEKYRQETALVEYSKNPALQTIDSRALLSVFGQNLTGTSHIELSPNYQNDMELKFTNSYVDYSIVNSTASSVDSILDSTHTKKDIKISLIRHNKAIVYDHEMIFSPKEFNNTITLGLETAEKVLKPSFELYKGMSFLSLYGDQPYTTKTTSYNISTQVSLRDESSLQSGEPVPKIYVAYMNVDLPRPYTDERVTFSLSSRIANETPLPNNRFSYWMQFNTSVPLLKFKTSTQGAILSSEKDFIIHLNETTMTLDEMKLHVLVLGTDLVSNTDKGTYWVLKLLSPVYNHTFNVTLFKDDTKGWVLGYNTTHNNTYTDLLNVTHTANMTFSREAVSLNGMFYHPWLQATMTNVLTPSGPIKRFHPTHVKDIAVEVYEKAKEFNGQGLLELVKDVAEKARTSRLELVNSVRTKTPNLANLTMDNSFIINGSLLHNVFEFEVNRSEAKCGSSLRIDASALLEKDGWRNGLSYRVKGGSLPGVTGNHTFSILRVDPSNIGVDNRHDFLFSSRYANLTINGDFAINRMNRPWHFDSITGGLNHNLVSPLINSSMDSGVLFDTFTNLTNFKAIDSFLTHSVDSKWVNSSFASNIRFDGFRSLFNFDDISTKLTHNFNSILTNWTTGANFNLRNVQSLFMFDRLEAGATHDLTSRWTNMSTTATYTMDRVQSPFNFDSISGNVLHRITSPWSDMTTNGLLQFNNFRSLFNFDSIHGSGENTMSSVLGSWTNNAAVDFTNFRSIFNFDRIFFQADNRVDSLLVNSSNTGILTVNNVRSIFNFDRVTSSAVHTTTTRWGDWSTQVGMALTNFQSLFNFHNAIFGARHDLSSLWYNTTTESELSLREVRSLFNFQKVMAVMEHSTNTTLGNWKTNSGLSLNEFVSLFNFRNIEAGASHEVNSKWVNWTTEYSMVLDDFRSLTMFNNATSGFSTVLNTKWGNMATSTGIEFDRFLSLLEFDGISSFFRTVVNTNLINATHTMNNKIANSRGLFNFESATSKMTTNVNSVLGNAELYNGIELSNFLSLTRFRKINHTLVASVTAEYLNGAALSELVVENSRGIFSFGKIQHHLRSHLKSPFLNGTMHNDLNLLNFASLWDFSTASLETFHDLTTPITDMKLMQFYGIYGMNDILTFDRASASVIYEGQGPLGELNLKHEQEIEGMSGLFKIQFANLSQVANMKARFFSLTTHHSQVTRAMDSPFKFERVSGSVNYTVSTPVGVLRAYGNSDLNDFKEIFKFRLINHTGILNFTSKYVNLNHSSQIEFNNFRRLFGFDLINANTTTNFSSPLGNLSTSSAAELRDFRALSQFLLIRANNTVNVSSSHLNVTTMHGVEMNNIADVFTFDRVNASSRVNVSSPLGVGSNIAEIGFHNFHSLFNFRLINFTNFANATSRYVNGTSRTDVDFSNFTRMLAFESIIGITSNNLTTPFFNTTGHGGIEMHNFKNLFTFCDVSAGVGAALKSRFVNSSGIAQVEFHNSSKLFTFERLNTTVKANLTTPVVNTTAVGYLGFHNFKSLFDFSRINSTINTTVSSWLANMTTNGTMELNNMTGFSQFDLLNGTTHFNFTSRLFNVTAATKMEINTMTGFVSFLRMINNASLNVTSKLANLTTGFHSLVDNMKGITMYDGIFGNVSLNFTSKMANLTTGTGLVIKNMSGLMMYDRIHVNNSMIFKSCPVIVNVSTILELHDITGFSKLDRGIGYASFNVTSKLANITSISHMQISNMSGVGRFEHIGGNASLIFNSNLGNLTTRHNIKLNTFTSLVSFKKISTTSSLHAIGMETEIDMKGGIEAENVEMLSFNRINGSISSTVSSPLVNLNHNIGFGLYEFTDLTHFGKVNGTLVWDLVVTDLATAGQNSFFTLDQFRGLGTFSGISGGTWIYLNSPIFTTGVRTNLNVDDAYNFFQLAEMVSDVTLIENRYHLILRESVDNARLLLNATIPSRGSLCLKSYLNPVGDELLTTVFHQKMDVKTVDLTWLMKLNNTEVVYSNISWNPETVRAIREFEQNVYENILEMVGSLSGATKTYLEKALNLSAVAVRHLKYAYYHPVETFTTFRESELVQEKLIRGVSEAAKAAYQRYESYIKSIISRMDFTTVDSTISSFNSLREVVKIRNQINERIDEVSEKIDEVIEYIIAISKDPANPVNVLLLDCLDMNMFDTAIKGIVWADELGKYALERSQFFSNLAWNVTLYSTEWAVNIGKHYTDWAIYQVDDYTVLLYDHAVNISKYALEYGSIYWDTIANFSKSAMEYAVYYKDWALDTYMQAVEVCEPYITWVIEYTEPYRVQAVEYSKQLATDVRSGMVAIYRKTVPLVEETMRLSKMAYRKGVKTVADASAYLIQICNDPEHIVNRYAMTYLLEDTIYQTCADVCYRISNLTVSLYKKAAIEYQEYYNKMEELYDTYYPKLEEKYNMYYARVEEFIRENLSKLEMLSKDEAYVINTYLQQYLGKNLFEVFEWTKAKLMSLKEEALLTKVEIVELVKRIPKQPLEITKEEVMQFIREKYNMVYQLVDELAAQEPISSAVDKVKRFLHWVNQTRFEPLEQTFNDLNVFATNTQVMALALVDDLKASEEYRKVAQFVNDIIVREDVNKTLEVIKKMLRWVNQTRFQTLEQTKEEALAFIEENYAMMKVVILNFPVESNVRKVTEVLQTLTDESKIILYEYLNWANETLQGLKITTEAWYLEAKDVVIAKWTYLKEETPYVDRAKELLDKTVEVVKENIDFTKEYAQLLKDTTVTVTTDVIRYVNGTVAGWFFRYYELDQFFTVNRYITLLFDTPETITYIVHVVLDEVPAIVDNGLAVVDMGLNTVGQVGEHSYAVNISHPFAWGSFRQPPNLTEAQWMLIMDTKYLIEQNIIEPSINKIEELLDFADNTQTVIRNYIKDVYDLNKPTIDRRLEELKLKIQELQENIREEYQNLPTLEQLKSFDQLAEKYPILQDIRSNLTRLQTTIEESLPTTEELQAKWVELRRTISEWTPTVEEIKSNLTLLMTKLETYWDIAMSNIEGNYLIAKDYIIETYPVVMDITQEIIKNVTEKVQEVYELVLEEYPNAWEHGQRLLELLKNKTLELPEELPLLYDKAKELAQEYYNFVLKQYPVYLEKTKEVAQEWVDYIKEYYPAIIEKTKELATEWIDYVEERCPTVVTKLKDLADQVRNKIEAEYPQYREKIEQGIEKIKEIIDYLSTLHFKIPTEKLLALRYYRPFSSEATAMIFSELHVLTFDQHLFEHPGYLDPECAYVLATDYVDNNFTLVSNEHNIILSLKGIHIKIGAQNDVYIDGAEIPKNIPFQTQDKSVTVVYDGPWVNVTSVYGIRVSCNSKHFLCIVSLSSWYHGKTRGLLGNLDREARTDRIKPDGQNATNLIDFVNAYETTGRLQCRFTRFTRPAPIPGCISNNRQALQTHCSEFFNPTSSPLKQAFARISPVEWQQECNNLAQNCRDICSVTTGYVALARSKGIGLIDPCERCGEWPVEANWTETKVVYGADIIVTISENRRFAGREILGNLKTLVNKLDKTIKTGKAPMTDNRYGLSAFGGRGIQDGAHIHSIHGQVVNVADRVPDGLDGLEFEGTNHEDAFDAIKLASEYVFRPGAAKIVILIVENERLSAKSAMRLDELQQMLTDRGVVLYVVSNYDALQKKSSAGAPLGVQYDGTIISTKKTKDAKVTTFMDIPSGDYAKLAKATRGSIFRLDMLVEGNDDLITTLSKVVRNDAIPIMAGEVGRQCKCVINAYGLAISECRNIWK